MNPSEQPSAAPPASESPLETDERSERLKHEALAGFYSAGSVLVEILSHWDAQAEKVRQIVWSIHNGSHLVPLGHACSGLDTKAAEAVAAVITARLLVGEEIEEKLKILLVAAGEFDRFEQAEAEQTANGLPHCYPLPMECPGRLRELADAIEACR